MKKVNGILIVDYKDLNVMGRVKDMEDIDIADIAESMEPAKEADYVIYCANNGEMKILKHKYPIHINKSKIW